MTDKVTDIHNMPIIQKIEKQGRVTEKATENSLVVFFGDIIV